MISPWWRTIKYNGACHEIKNRREHLSCSRDRFLVLFKHPYDLFDRVVFENTHDSLEYSNIIENPSHKHCKRRWTFSCSTTGRFALISRWRDEFDSADFANFLPCARRRHVVTRGIMRFTPLPVGSVVS